jgi:iron complex transport system substrate-binding protein
MRPPAERRGRPRAHARPPRARSDEQGDRRHRARGPRRRDPIYEIDVEGLERAKPDVIVTQDLCDLCAVSIEDVRAAVARLARRDVRLVNVGPMALDHVWSDIQRTADAIGRRDLGAAIVTRLKERVAEVEQRARRRRVRPKVVTIEWLEPLMLGGLWMPELVALAGGTPLGARVGAHGPTPERSALEALDPDVVLVAPCGFTVERTLGEIDVLHANLPRRWRAVRERRVYVADGNAFFNRPGPRIVESLELLATCVHPDAFADVAARHPRALLRL